MTSCSFSGNQPAYLLAAVAHMLKRGDLTPDDREIYHSLRDVLAVGMPLDPEIRRAIGLDDDGEPRDPG